MFLLKTQSTKQKCSFTTKTLSDDVTEIREDFGTKA